MNAKAVQPELLPPNQDEIVDIPVRQLLLDSENPRLAGQVETGSQEELARIMWTVMKVDEVAWSIAENGYFRSEPLFVIIENPQELEPAKRKYVVIEGNRRLTAVMLLRDQRLRAKLRATNLPEIDEVMRVKLDRLPAIIFPSRESLWTTVGFRHINGIKPWDSFSKAKYVADVHEMYNIPLREIADRIGDKHATVVRLYRGYKVLEQAEAEGLFDKQDKARNRFYFSHLYTAVDQRAFQDFLGIEPETSLRSNPVPPDKHDELRELMTWLYGSRTQDLEPIVQRQNPDLNTLREVVSKPDSLAALRRSSRLNEAYDVALGDRQRFRIALTNSKLEIQKTKATVTTGYAGEDDLFVTIEDIAKYVATVHAEMEAIRDKLSSRSRDTTSLSTLR
jgi:hypothetical protein